MSIKRVPFGSKPSAKPAETADDWVNNRSAPEPMKRLTIDVPESLHRRIKMACAEKGVRMADDLRELLERTYT
jgi:hypothetical protein